MQTKHLCVLIHIWTKGEVGAPLNWFKPSSKIVYWPFQGGTSFVDLLCFFLSCVCYCLCTCPFICVLWSPAGKGVTSWLSVVVSDCEFVTFPFVSWVRCGTWSYRSLIFEPLFTLTSWLSFLMSICEFVSFPLVSWVRCDAWLYQFLIFALFLSLLMLFILHNTDVSVFQLLSSDKCEFNSIFK